MKKVLLLIIIYITISSLYFINKAEAWFDPDAVYTTEWEDMRNHYERIEYDIDGHARNGYFFMLMEDFRKIDELIEAHKAKEKASEHLSHLDINSNKYYACDQIEWRLDAIRNSITFKQFFFRIEHAPTLKDGLDKLDLIVKFWDDFLKYYSMERTCKFWTPRGHSIRKIFKEPWVLLIEAVKV